MRINLTIISKLVFTTTFTILSLLSLSKIFADSVYARTGTSSNGNQTLTYSVDDKIPPAGSMGWSATITNNGASTYNTTLTASVPAEVTVAALNGWSQVGSRLYYNMSVAPGRSQTATWFGQGIAWIEAYKATSSIETNDLSMVTSTYVIFYAQLGFVVRNQSSSVQQVSIRVYNTTGALAGTSGTIPLAPGDQEIIWLNNSDGNIISCDLNPYTVYWSTATIPWTATNVSVNPINVRNNQIDQVTITITSPPTPTPTNTPTPTPTTPPGVTPPPTPTPTSAPKTASLSASCPGGTPTLTANWSVGSGSNCNAYIVAGFSAYQISTSCSGSWSGSQLPGGPLIVNGGIYHLYVGDPSGATTDGGQATVSCGAVATPTPNPGVRPCDWCTNRTQCNASSGYTFYDDVWDYCAASEDGLCCGTPPPPAGGMACLECKFNYWSFTRTFMITYESDYVSACNIGWGGQAYGPLKDRNQQAIDDCRWIREVEGGNCPHDWSATSYGLRECICGEETSQSGISFSPANPTVGQPFTVKVTSYKGYTDVSLLATSPSGAGKNFGPPNRIYTTYPSIQWNPPSPELRTYSRYNWEWNISLSEPGNYTFKLYAGDPSPRWNCVTGSLTIASSPPTCDGINFAPPSINNLIQGESTPLIVTGLKNPKNYTGVSRVNFVPSSSIVTVNPASDTTSADGFKTTVTAQSVGSGNITATAFLTGPGGTGSCSGTVPVTVTTPSAWIQTVGGDAHVQGDLTDKMPLNKYFSSELDAGAGNKYAAGVVSVNGSRDFGLGSVSQKPPYGWLLAGPPNGTTGDYSFDNYPATRYDYEYFDKKISSVLPWTIGSNPIQSQLNALTSGSYRVTGPLTLMSNGETWNLNQGGVPKKIILLVDGDVTIRGKIFVNNPEQGAFVAIITNGNIIIAPGVYDPSLTTAALVGVFIADGQISTGTAGGSTDDPLVVSGVFAAHGGFNLQRNNKDHPTLAKSSQNFPAEKFMYNPSLMMETPDLLKVAPFVWQEVAP